MKQPNNVHQLYGFALNEAAKVAFINFAALRLCEQNFPARTQRNLIQNSTFKIQHSLRYRHFQLKQGTTLVNLDVEAGIDGIEPPFHISTVEQVI